MKHQASTAIAVFHEDIRPTLSARQQFVMSELVAFISLRRHSPTSSELLKFVTDWKLGRFDVNSIRPRLTELEALGLVRHGVQRACGVTGKTCMTWEPATPERPAQQTLELR